MAIITDYNKMTLEELRVISAFLGISFVIDNGKITGASTELKSRRANNE